MYIGKYVSSVNAFNSVVWCALGTTSVVLLGLVMVGLGLCTHPTSCIYRRGKCAVQEDFFGTLCCILINLE